MNGMGLERNCVPIVDLSKNISPFFRDEAPAARRQPHEIGNGKYFILPQELKQFRGSFLLPLPDLLGRGRRLQRGHPSVSVFFELQERERPVEFPTREQVLFVPCVRTLLSGTSPRRETLLHGDP